MEIPEFKAKLPWELSKTPNPQPDRRSIWPSSRPSEPLEEEVVEEQCPFSLTTNKLKRKS